MRQLSRLLWTLYLVAILFFSFTIFLKFVIVFLVFSLSLVSVTRLFILFTALIFLFFLTFFLKELLKKPKLILTALLLYLCLRMIANETMPLSTLASIVFGDLSQAVFASAYQDGPSDKASEVKNIHYPFLWKTIIYNWRHDLMHRQESFPSFHYFLTSSDGIYYENNKKLDDMRTLICILKNLGRKSIIINEIEEIVINKTADGKKWKDIAPDAHPFYNSGAPKGLSAILNEKLKLNPLILRPSQEIILYQYLFALTSEDLKMEIKIKYYDYENENWAKGKLQTYFQQDSFPKFQNPEKFEPKKPREPMSVNSFIHNLFSFIKQGNSRKPQESKEKEPVTASAYMHDLPYDQIPPILSAKTEVSGRVCHLKQETVGDVSLRDTP